MIIADTCGNNQLCCRYNSSGNNNEDICLCNKCRCKFHELAKVPRVCQFITVLDYKRSLHDEEFAKSISQHPVRSAINELPIADQIRLVAGMTPPDNLHVFHLGIYVLIIKIVHDLIGKANKNAKWKDLIDQLHQNIALDIQRQSYRGFHRCSTKFGFMDLTRVTGVERAGNLFVFNVALHTKQGEDIMRPFLERANISLRKMKYALNLLLSYEEWYMSVGIPRLDVITAEPAVNELANKVKESFPRKASKKTVEQIVPNSPVRKKEHHQATPQNIRVVARNYPDLKLWKELMDIV